MYSRVGSILITHLEDSVIAERFWHTIHTDLGCILFGTWYRPPGSPHNHIVSLDGELERLSAGMIGCLVMGDLNIWHKSWLKHSPADTWEGKHLHVICKEQKLEAICHGANNRALLDLALSSLGLCRVNIGGPSHR